MHANEPIILRSLYHVNGEIPSQKDSNAELWCFLSWQPKYAVEQTVELSVIWDAMRLM